MAVKKNYRNKSGRTGRMAIPNLGNYTIALDCAVRCMGLEPWSSTATSNHAMKLGIASARDSLCLPFKAHLGHFIEADNAGCEHAIMVNSTGTCRLTYYRVLIENILREQGRKIRIWGLGFDGFKPPVFRYFDPGFFQFVVAVRLMIEKILTIDTIETLAWQKRPAEYSTGETSRVMKQCLEELAALDERREVKKFHTAVKERFNGIKTDASFRPLYIGLIGEVSVLRDLQLNQNIEQILGHMGCEVRNFFLLGAELGNLFGISFGEKALTTKQLAKTAFPYLKNPVGGHALDSVARTILCARDGFDAMIHLCPAGCMPEVSVRPILSAVSRDKDIPVLEISFDEHTSATGIITRLEAFIDILKDRRRRGLGPAALKHGRIVS